jgi:hypothetical protein
MGAQDSDDQALYIAGEPKAVTEAGRDGDYRRRSDGMRFAAEGCVAGPRFDVQDLKECLMPMKADFPLVAAASRPDGFAMQPEIMPFAQILSV